tara:strand:+ start:910 stop:2358 length:1449 start_codon:yes stop_codon:yes gene_type:complete
MNAQPDTSREFAPADDDTYRLLPHNVEAEQALLGAIFVNNDAFYLVSDFLQAGHFYEELHQKIYEICVQMIADGKKANPITVKDYLPADFMVDEVPISKYLIGLAVNATGVSSAKDFGRTIQDLATRRLLIAAAEDLMNAAMDMPANSKPETVASEAIEALQGAVHGKKMQGLRSIHELAVEAVNKTSEAYQGKSLIGYSTGLNDLDKMIDCMAPGELIALYGRSGGAKTALATQIGMNVARACGKVLMIQMEMQGFAIAQRVLSSATGISVQRQRGAKIGENDFERLLQEQEALKDLPFSLINPGRMTWNKMAAYVEAVKRVRGLDMVIIDHHRLITPEPKQGQIETIEEAFYGMMDLKARLNLIMMPLVQLKREDPRYEISKPKIYDAWGGGAIEQSADVILATHNEYRQLIKNEPDKSTSKHGQWLEKCDRWEGKIEIGVLKYRNGEEQPYKPFLFAGERMLFSDVSKPEYEASPMGLF